jgi:hypothetical protein
VLSVGDEFVVAVPKQFGGFNWYARPLAEPLAEPIPSDAIHLGFGIDGEPISVKFSDVLYGIGAQDPWDAAPSELLLMDGQHQEVGTLSIPTHSVFTNWHNHVLAISAPLQADGREEMIRISRYDSAGVATHEGDWCGPIDAESNGLGYFTAVLEGTDEHLGILVQTFDPARAVVHFCSPDGVYLGVEPLIDMNQDTLTRLMRAQSRLGAVAPRVQDGWLFADGNGYVLITDDLRNVASRATDEVMGNGRRPSVGQAGQVVLTPDRTTVLWTFPTYLLAGSFPEPSEVFYVTSRLYE